MYSRVLEVLTWLVYMNVPVMLSDSDLAIPLLLHLSLSSCFVNGITYDVKVEANSLAKKINLANVCNKSGDENHHFRPWKTTPDILKHFRKIR